ncbi:uncharacterized protein METZ01_LOCUS218125 [marine metagenome]|uniref:Uncharacterized protein n=1 Tax=marine metagenome TaxID=408172 RepID=A0A382FTH8_9ZZZZ
MLHTSKLRQGSSMPPLFSGMVR